MLKKADETTKTTQTTNPVNGAGANGHTSPTPNRLQQANAPAARAMKLHPQYRGKMATVPKCPVNDMDDFAVWYSPGVAEPCRAIAAEPDLVYEYTGKWNTIAVVSDGSRVLGLGDIGPKAGLPVMEGKAMLYKYLGGVDAVALTLDTRDADEIIETVLRLQPAFGGVNLEDIAMPKCFRVLEELRSQAEIPVWHDDQQGTATVTLAGLMNALKVVGKEIGDVSIAFIGTGAANVACARLIWERGADPARSVMVDSRGILGRHRSELEQVKDTAHGFKWQLCEMTNSAGRRGGIAEALAGTDVVIALSQCGPSVIRPEWVSEMNADAIVFACANPVPEIWPWEAQAAGAAVVATGRSDFPNQVNNSLGFPGIFRGAIDVRAHTITDEMCFTAADALAGYVGERLAPDFILPTMAEWEVFAHEAAAVGMVAQAQGVAHLTADYDTLLTHARQVMQEARQMNRLLMREGLIAAPQA